MIYNKETSHPVDNVPVIIIHKKDNQKYTKYPTDVKSLSSIQIILKEFEKGLDPTRRTNWFSRMDLSL